MHTMMFAPRTCATQSDCTRSTTSGEFRTDLVTLLCVGLCDRWRMDATRAPRCQLVELFGAIDQIDMDFPIVTP
jgi:hypothetical protein